MATTTNYVQLPPDGVGKKVRHRIALDLRVTQGNTVPSVGETLHGGTSAATGILTGIYSAEDTTYYLRGVTGTWSVGESVLDASDAVCATVTEVVPNMYAPALNIVDADIPEYTLTVDKRGAALTSFPEGTPQFDAWGRQQLSQMLAVGEYYHFVQDLAAKYFTTTEGASSSVVFSPTQSSVIYTTGTGATDWAKRVTNQYHPYKPGVSQLIYVSATVGDTGKANVVREWGYFDDFNGFGFRLDGTTLKVFYRSDSTGTVVDTTVSQADWNVNTLNNATSSDFLLNVSKSNLYWMDIQGTIGRIRLGVETPDGRRITCHEFRNINNITTASVRNLSLPLTFAQRNTGSVSASPASTQSMRIGAAVVFTESADVQYTGVLTHIIPDEPITLTDSEEYKPFLQFKAKSTVSGPTQAATAIISGFNYTIDSVGTTNWTSIGASANIAGVRFTATGSAAGTGTAHVNLPNSIIGIHETFDWASQGNTNIHVGIFVLPSERWIVGHQWSETIQPATMLYVDQTSTSMAQYQYWSTKASNVAGNITSTTMTVSSLQGRLLKEMFIAKEPLFADGPLTAGFKSNVGDIVNKTQVIEQLTSAETPNATPTYGSQTATSGITGSNRLVVSSTTGIYPEQLISGNGLPQATFVQGLESGNIVVLSKSFTSNGSGTYNFYQPGGPGTYRLNKNNGTISSFHTWGAYYAFHPIESFMAPANSAGRAALGDRIEKSFGLGGNPNPPEDAKGVFAFAAKPMTANVTATLMYTKYWKEIR